ncbi:MAG: hypothetical protein ACLVEF_04780 [Bifidobacterium bifidum]
MNDDHDMTRHLPNAEAMPADFEQTEALPTLVGGVSEQASAVTQALPVEPTQALPVEPTQTLPVAETEAMPVEKVAVPQTETKSLPVDSASTEKLSAEPLAAGAVSDESAAPVDDGQTETEPAADAFGSPAAASDRRTGDVPAGATTAGDVPYKGQPLAAAPSTDAGATQQPDAATAFAAGDTEQPGPASQQIPLYSTQPPREHDGYAPNRPDVVCRYAASTDPQFSRGVAQLRASAADVPVRPVIRKTGPSAATLTLGVFMLLVGAVAILFGVRFPNGVLAWFDMDPRVMFAIGCAVVGGALILIAIIWSLAKIARNARTPHGE